MNFNRFYIAVIVVVFAAFTVVFATLPRSTYSELEKRELAVFPAFSPQALADGSFTAAVSSWFSDSEPFRDDFMLLSMHIKDLIRVQAGNDNVTFHASADTPMPLPTDDIEPEPVDSGLPFDRNSLANENAKIANAGIIIVGSGPNVRALMAYGGGAQGGTGYAQAANTYKETFPTVNVYCMVIPMSTDFYVPDKVRSRTRSQRPTIENIHAHLSPDVKAVDVYPVLERHAGEDIYLRTDHHWAPLGGYYAAREFARVAGVPFRDLSSYDRHVVHGYVGSMYGYSNDLSVKHAPEDFVYYTPRGVDYTTTYIIYTIDRNYHVTGESRPMKGPFFYKFKDGSGGAYCTFMGGDTKLTQVRTSTHNGRRLLLLKDSFGNALPGYLFYSFEEIHVVDSRYFTKNMKEYVEDNHITDILFANNTFKAYSSHAYSGYLRFLTQHNGIQRPTTTPDSVKAKTTPAPAATTDTAHTRQPATAVPTPAAPAQPDTLGVD